MKYLHFLITTLVAFSFLTFSSCTKYIIIEPEEIDPGPTNPVKNPYEALFNTTWEQTSYSYTTVMNPDFHPTVNENAIIEFTDIKYKNTSKYIIKQNSEPIGLYYLNSDEYNEYINLDWYAFDPDNGWKYQHIYGYGRFEIKFTGESNMNYSRLEGSGYSTYYYTKISPE